MADLNETKIRIKRNVLNSLNTYKIHPRQAYSEVIEHLLAEKSKQVADNDLQKGDNSNEKQR